MLVQQGASFNPDYAAGVTSLTVEGKDSTDVLAVLVNDATGAKANIGTYHVDFNTHSSQQMSGDIAAAFQQVTVGGGTPATTTASQTAPPTTQAPDPVTTAAPAQPDTQPTQPQTPDTPAE